VLACSLLGRAETAASESQAKKNVVQAVKDVAAQLGNTPAVCRRCYVHPAVLESYMGGAMLKSVEKNIEERISQSPHELRREELDLLHLLEGTAAKMAQVA